MARRVHDMRSHLALGPTNPLMQATLKYMRMRAAKRNWGMVDHDSTAAPRKPRGWPRGAERRQA